MPFFSRRRFVAAFAAFGLAGAAVALAASPGPKVGDPAKEFELPALDGGTEKTVRPDEDRPGGGGRPPRLPRVSVPVVYEAVR